MPEELPKMRIWGDKHPGTDPLMRIFKNRQEISSYVGYPVLSACEALYDKNIRTVESIWKKGEVIKYLQCALIIVHYDSLSTQNKAVAGEIMQEQGTTIRPARYGGEQMNIFEIKVPVTEETKPEEIENSLKSIVGRFEPQEKTWA